MSSSRSPATSVHLPQYHEIFERSGDIILALDGDHRIVFASPQWVRATGLSTTETEGRPFPRWFSSETRRRWQDALEQLAAQDEACTVALTLEVPERSPIELEGWVMTETGPSRRLALQLVLHDLTERNRLERQRQAYLERIEAQNLELARRIREAEQSSRLKSELLATVSHELRTPVNAICGFTDLLDDPSTGELSELQASYLAFVRQGAHHLRDLIGDVLDLTRLETGSLPLDSQPVRLAPVVGEVASMTALLARERDISLRLQVEPSLEVHGDAVRLRQILLNLVCNALRYSPIAGEVLVAAERHSTRCLVTVVDQGPGLLPSLHEKVFEEFRRPGSGPRDPSGGTGLGLAIVRRLVEAQGGKVWVESEGRGDGCRFGFYLPTEPPPPSPAPAPGAVSEVVPRQPRIVLAGGPAGERRQRLAELDREGYDAVETSPEDLPGEIASLSPLAWVLDLDGVSDPWPVVERLAAGNDPAGDHPNAANHGTATPLAIVIASQQEKSAAFLRGVDHYLVKPVTLGAISDCLRAHYPELARGAETVVLVMPAGERRDEAAEALVEAGLRPITADDGRRALRLIQELQPYAAVVAMDLPDLDGRQTLIRLRSDPLTALMPVVALAGDGSQDPHPDAGRPDAGSSAPGDSNADVATHWIEGAAQGWAEAVAAALSGASRRRP